MFSRDDHLDLLEWLEKLRAVESPKQRIDFGNRHVVGVTYDRNIYYRGNEIVVKLRIPAEEWNDLLHDCFLGNLYEELGLPYGLETKQIDIPQEDFGAVGFVMVEAKAIIYDDSEGSGESIYVTRGGES